MRQHTKGAIILILCIVFISGVWAEGDLQDNIKRIVQREINENTDIDSIKWNNIAIELAKDSISIDNLFYESMGANIDFLKQGNYSGALEILQLWEQYFSINNKDTTLLPIKSYWHNIYGAAYQEMGMNTIAIDNYFKALSLFQEANNQDGIAKSLNNLGNIYFEQEEYNKSDSLFQQALTINLELDNKEELFNNYNNLSCVYLKQKLFQKALDLALKASEVAYQQGDKYSQAFIYTNIGNIYIHLNEDLLAISYLKKAINIQQLNHYSLELIRTKNILSDAYINNGETDKALQQIEEAIQLSRKVKNPKINKFTYWNAAKLYKERSDINNLWKYSFAYKSISDSLHNIDMTEKLGLFQDALNFERKQKENLLLKQQISINQMTIKMQLTWVIAISCIFIIALIFILILLKKIKQIKRNNKKLKQQSEQIKIQEQAIRERQDDEMRLKLDYKNRQLVTYTLMANQNNEFAAKVEKELKLLQLQIKPRDKEKREKLNEILNEFRRFKTQNSWEEFRVSFEKVHPNFYKKLLSVYPNLTSNEQKLCGLIRLGLSNKAISSITFKEIRSIDSARNRLRKKLSLESDVDLHLFLLKF
ncbi:MAG: tetratricopeptide repeat protein [Hyphomicrobiales bacterium]